MIEATTADEVNVTVGVRELKNQLSRYLEQVKAGVQVIVTQHGTPIARLTAVGSVVDTRQALIEAGIVVPAPTTKRQLPKKQAIVEPGRSVAELVADQRR